MLKKIRDWVVIFHLLFVVQLPLLSAVKELLVPCIKAMQCTSVLPKECGTGEPLNLGIAKDCIRAYFECGQYDRDMESVVNQAIAALDKIPITQNATIFWDIDDTLLHAYYCDSKGISFGYIPELWHDWIMRGDAKAIPQAKKLFDFAKQKGFKNIGITGRKANEYDVTKKNLEEQGFVLDELIVRQPDEEELSAVAYKSKHRKNLIGKNNIGWAATIGDQQSDHDGGYTNLAIKFPNPAYLIK